MRLERFAYGLGWKAMLRLAGIAIHLRDLCKWLRLYGSAAVFEQQKLDFCYWGLGALFRSYGWPREERLRLIAQLEEVLDVRKIGLGPHG